METIGTPQAEGVRRSLIRAMNDQLIVQKKDEDLELQCILANGEVIIMDGIGSVEPNIIVVTGKGQKSGKPAQAIVSINNFQIVMRVVESKVGQKRNSFTEYPKWPR